MPADLGRRVTWRYLLSELDEYRMPHQNSKRFRDPQKEELPAIVAAKILAVTVESLYVLKSRGRLRDYRPETIRTYLLKANSRNVAREVKRRARFRESNLRWEISRLRKRASLAQAV